MKPMQQNRARGRSRLAVYAANLFISCHYFVIIYVTSTYLSGFVSTETVSILYVAGSIMSIGLFAVSAALMKRFGNWRVALAAIMLEAVALALLGFAHAPGALVAAALLFIAVSPVIYLSLDVFLEKSVTKAGEELTGGIRGMFLSMQNITQVVAPFLAGALVVTNFYSRAYAASLAFLAIGFLIIAFGTRALDDGRYHARSLWRSAAYVFRHPILYDVAVAQFILRFFYAWMVIYVPLYLSRTVGFSWPQIGLMFSIMLLPFLFLELPLGRLEDRDLVRERSVLVAGLAVMAASVAFFPFISAPVFGLWAAALFISRVGASCTEIATESYFFRHVDGSLADAISFFRVLRPAGYVAAAAVAAATLQFTNLRWSFLVLAAVCAFGLRYAVRLRGK